MELLASGRDSDVYLYDDGLVLRRYRDGRSAEHEAATIRALGAVGYPVPEVHTATGPDIVMERVEGRTLAEEMLEGLSPQGAGATLASLHDRLHELPWAGAAPGESLLHLDLHPLNVIMRGSAPVVIDWSNARPGPAGLDVAMTVLILAQVVVTEGLLASTGLEDDRLRTAAARLAQDFSVRVGTQYVDQLPAAELLRRQDPNQTAAERDSLRDAVEWASSLA